MDWIKNTNESEQRGWAVAEHIGAIGDHLVEIHADAKLDARVPVSFSPMRRL
jgi:hypothetical protein